MQPFIHYPQPPWVLANAWLSSPTVPDALLSGCFVSGTQSFMQGRALNLFNRDLSVLAFTPVQPQSMLRHTGPCTCLPTSLCNSHHLRSDTSQFLSESLLLPSPTDFLLPHGRLPASSCFDPFHKMTRQNELLGLSSSKGNWVQQKQSDLNKIRPLGSCKARIRTISEIPRSMTASCPLACILQPQL